MTEIKLPPGRTGGNIQLLLSFWRCTRPDRAGVCRLDRADL